MAADPCYARSHLIRSRVLRINSMYASERAEIQKAYDIDPTDPDIQRAWQGIVSPAHEIEGIDQSLATMKDLDPEIRKKAEASIDSMMPLLTENSQTCKCCRHCLPPSCRGRPNTEPASAPPDPSAVVDSLHAPIAVLLAIFDLLVRTQVHGWQHCVSLRLE